MRIVIAHNFIGPHGGAEQSTYKIYLLLKEQGHEVYLFGSDYRPYFEENLHLNHLFPKYTNYDDIKSPLKIANSFLKPFWNFEAQHKFANFLDLVKPDLVHFGSVHWHLSPSVIASCNARNIPTVMTLRESRHVCPAGTLLRSGNTYCDKVLCTTGHSFNALKHNCYEGSFLKSAFVSFEFEFRKYHKLFNSIDQFICPSKALSDLVKLSSIPDHRLNVIPNFVDELWLSTPPSKEVGKYFLYAGRLSKEKGVHLLINAMQQLSSETMLKIVGEGEEESSLREMVKKLGLHNVEFLGRKNSEDLKGLYREAIAVVLPCFWFENFPRTLIESMACGRPAIASNIGGCSESVIDYYTGLLVEPNNINHLAKAMKFLMVNPDKALEYGSNGFARVNEEFSIKKALDSHLKVYNRVLVKNGVS